jgi:hypothetical protein
MDKVDVLAVMDLAQGTLRLAARGGDFSLAGNQTMAHQDSIGIAEALAAVAELIKADAEYDAANLALQLFDSNELDADEEAAAYDALCQRFDAARDRRASALARVQGGAK